MTGPGLPATEGLQDPCKSPYPMPSAVPVPSDLQTDWVPGCIIFPSVLTELDHLESYREVGRRFLSPKPDHTLSLGPQNSVACEPSLT